VFLAVCSASEMTYIVSGGALNSTHSLILAIWNIEQTSRHCVGVREHNPNASKGLIAIKGLINTLTYNVCVYSSEIGIIFLYLPR